MTEHEKAVQWSMTEYRHHVKEEPLGSNRGPRVTYYQSFDFLAGGGYPWCVDFFLAGWANAGRPLPYRTAGAYDMDNWARKVNWDATIEHLVPGDGVCVGIGAGHYCMYLDHTKTEVETINGNVSDKVDIRRWKRSSIRGYMHVHETQIIPPVKPPLYVVVTSVNGHKKVIVTARTWKQIQPFIPGILKKRGWNGFTIQRVKRGTKK